jgi:hypothetical protein
MGTFSEFAEYVGSPVVGATGEVLITACFARRLLEEHNALLAHVEAVAAERDVWHRRATIAEADADLLATEMSWRVDAGLITCHSVLRLHDKAVAAR